MASIETDKEKPKGIWIATKENVDEKEFEETRRLLLKLYHSNIQTHAGYIIALIIGLFTVVSAFKTFFDFHQWGIGVLGFIIVLIILSIGFMGLRIIYWTIWTNVAITVPFVSSLKYFNNVNEAYFSEAPNAEILTQAIRIHIQIEKGKNDFNWYQKIAFRLAGKSFE